MDWGLIWTVIEAVSNWLYQPLLFWGVPFLPAMVMEIVKARAD